MAGSLLGRDLRSIAVFMLRHIGDTLLSTPAFHALRAAFPSTRILAVVNEGTQEMLEGNPDIDEIVVFHRRLRNEGGFGRWKEEAALVRSLRAFRPELAINLTEGDRGAFLSALSGARYRVGVTPNRKGFLGKEILFTHLCGPHDRYRHAVLRDLDVVAAAGIPPAGLRLRFSISDEDREKAVRILREAGIAPGHPFAVVQPTSRWTFKCWTEDGMAGVISHLADRGFAPVVTSGPAPVEVAQAERIRERAGGRAVSLAGLLSLKDLGAVIASARLFVGVDSAPMHVSAAVGTPTVALFGPTGAFNWAPWEGIDWGYSVQGKGGTRFVGRHAVVQEEWDCVPCGKDGCEGTKRSRCMEDLSVEKVTEAVDRILSHPAIPRSPR
ncbi:MAG: putative lipopolysaccharide heptosyltransferase III [Deltaproteobacteria bacterium CG2_30_66_27]|nr:MAG: putative lipopolysaccharide heptosyltransferase III [Deltaproteobacteria bacterium CG2_30_66_27]PJB33091.1 MAG: putative lipopolysaccharide heptosyltransferase III [Deltaproteobacteria bacterium CG_4_9_14_3_um_filter_65_9]